MKRYDIVYSIGFNCSCAMYLNETGLRITSGPFDWLTNASFEDRINLILNDFESFLNKDLLVKLPKPPSHYDKFNEHYENTKTNLYFFHDFPLNKPFDIQYLEVKEKYERRIKRFYDNLKNKDRVLLVWLSQTHNTSDEVVLDLCNRVSEKIGKEIHFLIIEHEEGLRGVRRYNLSNNIERCYCHTQKKGLNGDLKLRGNRKYLIKIFTPIRLIRPYYTSMCRIKFCLSKILLKTLCCFVPVRGLRRKLKRKLLKHQL